MSDNEPTYAYDPFAKTAPRWGHQGVGGGETVPVIEGYEIRDKLGSGGMASVWSALYVPLNQIRAVKVLDSVLATDRSFIKRFQDEARALGRLEHPNIVKVFDANAEHDPPYIAMQWVEGQPLSQLLGSGLGQAQAIHIFEQIAEALDHAHTMGFTHRDLKPSNVMVAPDGKAMLIDFGVATLLGRDVNQGQSLTGTTRYLSPEVIEGRVAGAASDRWALAVMICRVFAGALPFDDPNAEVVLKKIASDSPTIPAHAPARLRQFLVRALEKEPAKRYRTCREMVSDLKSALQPIPISMKGDTPKIAMASGLALVVIAASAFFGSKWIAGRSLAKPAENPPPIAATPPFEAAPMRSPSVPPPAEVDPRLKALEGPWFGDLGTRFAEGGLWPTRDGAAFMLNLRDKDKIVYFDFEGGFDPETQAFELAAGGASLTLEASADGSQLRGTLDDPDVGPMPVRFVRAKDVATTTYRNEKLGIQLEVPAGWHVQPESTEGRSVLVLTPLAAREPYLRLTSAPDDGQTDPMVALEGYETDVAATGTYTRVALNAEAGLGGRRSVSIDYRYQAGDNPVVQGSVHALLRQNQLVLLETGYPSDSMDLWQPLIHRLVEGLRFLDPPVPSSG